MSLNSLFGGVPATNRTYAPQLEVSQDNIGYAVAGEFAVDPTLPGLMVDQLDPRLHVAIPRGRIVGLGFSNGRGGTAFSQTITDTGKTVITLANGNTIKPVGIAPSQIFASAQEFMLDGFQPTYRRGVHVEVPYTLSINEAQGALRPGDAVSAYSGSTSSATPGVNIHTGKPVAWFARRTFLLSGSASATWNFTSGIYPGFRPEVIATKAAGAVVSGLTAAWAFTSGTWRLTLTGSGASTVDEVLVAYGQREDQIAGQVDRVRSITEMLRNDNWLKWVEDSFATRAEYPPRAMAMHRYPVTGVSQETPSTVIANSLYRVVNYPMSIYNRVLVEVRNVNVTDSAGNVTTYAADGAWFPLPTAAAPTRDSKHAFMGMYHSINWRTGTIQLSSAIAPISGNIAIRVSYSYITNPREGAILWGQGQLGLSDGANLAAATTNDAFNNSGASIVPANAIGTPAHLNYDDVVGGLRFFVKN